MPAFERVGISFTIIAMVDEEAEHGELEIVHSKIFVPNPKLVIEVVGDNEFVIVPLPEINVHTPVPTVAVFAAMIVFGLLIHNVCDVPAFETVGRSFTIIATVDEEGIHGLS
jgi:hypothetical protein